MNGPPTPPLAAARRAIGGESGARHDGVKLAAPARFAEASISPSRRLPTLHAVERNRIRLSRAEASSVGIVGGGEETGVALRSAAACGR